MKKWLMVGLILVIAGGFYWWWNRGWYNPLGNYKQLANRLYDQYDFDSLKKRGGVAGEIKIKGEAVEIVKRRRDVLQNVSTKVFTFQSNGKTISGTVNIPNPERSSLSPVIIVVRGYAEKLGYYPGSGSWRVADKLAEAGYVTFSIDFLGYGLSDEESTDVLEARFEKAESLMDLIASVKAIPWVDKNKIGIWAHSNGGQITLSVLETTGGRYPAVLWAPMTNPFPQSLIDTADEGEQKQKATEFVDVFLKHYDGRRFAFENYYQWITSPVLILQGTRDEWCKVEWQEKVVEGINSKGGAAKMSVYQGNDHNLSKDWERAVEETVGWYEEHL